MTTMRPLCRRMIEDMTICNLSRSTQQSYIYAVATFGRRFKRSPDRSARKRPVPTKLHLIEQKYSWTHINLVSGCACIALLGITLGQKEVFEHVVSGKEPEKLPPILHREEISRSGLNGRIFVDASEGCMGGVGNIRSDWMRE